MANKEAIEKLKELLFMTGYKEALNLAIKALKNDIVPVVIRDGDYEFDGMLDKNRQLLYAKPYTAEYVKKVLGMSWREADNDKVN